MKTEYVEWDEEKLEEWFKDKFRKRGLKTDEYVFITAFIRELAPKTVIDVGTFLGASGYILGTASPKLETLYALEHHEGPSFRGPYKGLVTTEEYGKYLPEYAIFRTYGYERDLEPILKKCSPNDTFIFFDAGKNPMRILHQIKLSHAYKIKYIAFHDANVKQVLNTLKHAEKIKLYRMYDRYEGEIPGKKGIVIMERM